MPPRKPARKGDKLAAPKEAKLARVLPLFAAGMPYSQIARMTGVSLRTIQRYALQDEVRELLEAQRETAAKTTLEAMLAAREVALAALLDVMSNEGASEDARVRAALGLLDRTGHGPTVKNEHTGAVQHSHTHKLMTVEEAKEKLKKVQARFADRGITPGD